MKNKKVVLSMIRSIREANMLAGEADMEDIDPVAQGWIRCHEATMESMLVNLLNFISTEEEEW